MRAHAAPRATDARAAPWVWVPQNPYDSTHGRFEGTVEAKDNQLIVNGKTVNVYTAMKPAEIVAEIKASGLRGRGGAAFPVGLNWESVMHQHDHVRAGAGRRPRPGNRQDRDEHERSRERRAADARIVEPQDAVDDGQPTASRSSSPARDA